ncbi:MAG: hypothetical protein IJS00_05545 [Paludibacteraceae bacterium]|nr:hypothetical protein [Paludibacteraceae bacterium]
MEIKGKVYCLFEQSGTFKNEFIKLGIPAEDYDIQNEFEQTDHVCDLFAEIEQAYRGGASVFDEITPDDLIMAFFPCIYFCENNTLMFSGVNFNERNQRIEEIGEYILQRSRERQKFYELILQLFMVAEIKHLRMIVENPHSEHHYLHNNFPYRPKVIDKDRTRRGDYYVKPTAYWYLNCAPTFGESYEKPKEKKTIRSASPSKKAGMCSEERSLISPAYARNFICDFILGKLQPFSQMSLFE